jgi:hypothetical protein
VQRCPQNPQEKRSTSTGKEIKTPKWNKRIKRKKWPKMNEERKGPRDWIKGTKEVMNLKQSK